MSTLIKRLTFKTPRSTMEQLRHDVEWILEHADCKGLSNDVFISNEFNFSIYQSEKNLTLYNHLYEVYSEILIERTRVKVK